MEQKLYCSPDGNEEGWYTVGEQPEGWGVKGSAAPAAEAPETEPADEGSAPADPEPDPEVTEGLDIGDSAPEAAE